MSPLDPTLHTYRFLSGEMPEEPIPLWVKGWAVKRITVYAPEALQASVTIFTPNAGAGELEDVLIIPAGECAELDTGLAYRGIVQIGGTGGRYVVEYWLPNTLTIHPVP